jgi:transposase-like protein
VETLTSPPQGWFPPHCPNPDCRYHRPSIKGWRYKRAGFFSRQHPPHRIQRYQCKACHRCFSTQTFSTTYWQKLPGLDTRIFMRLVGGMANRQIARDLGVRPKTIDDRISRVGRHCMLFHCRQMQNAPPVRELVVDGFETFELSQYYPFHINLAVEKHTDFIVFFTDSELRRKGRMTRYQRQRRSQLEHAFGRPDPRAIQKGMRELLEVSLKGSSGAIVYSDDHPSYPPAIRGVPCRISHRVTSSKARRTRTNPLWEVNLVDLLIRHSESNHKRETIAWSKRRQAALERLFPFLLWRNYIKRRREKVRGSPTPAMTRGMTTCVSRIDDIFGARIFRGHVDLPPRWSHYYQRTVETRALGSHRYHRLKYAY